MNAFNICLTFVLVLPLFTDILKDQDQEHYSQIKVLVYLCAVCLALWYKHSKTISKFIVKLYTLLPHPHPHPQLPDHVRPYLTMDKFDLTQPEQSIIQQSMVNVQSNDGTIEVSSTPGSVSSGEPIDYKIQSSEPSQPVSDRYSNVMLSSIE